MHQQTPFIGRKAGDRKALAIRERGTPIDEVVVGVTQPLANDQRLRLHLSELPQRISLHICLLPSGKIGSADFEVCWHCLTFKHASLAIYVNSQKNARKIEKYAI